VTKCTLEIVLTVTPNCMRNSQSFVAYRIIIIKFNYLLHDTNKLLKPVQDNHFMLNFSTVGEI